ncbi:putative leucine-rich repeat receptor-like serine/threonine-protein kinase At2g19230 isoform X3 [Prosopis cineraria]|uniref:putative leucine-rich repeat receptor-like serine/threonine-protein kinase At2g19230 isoform X3 n=1 Tax=Prosopis cineraria TaxID=364024 RepID=UPI00240FE3C5|nr:putative leucine-rich repeat receptor-like serine/threonine-protein kinase At2g19230 isoform X3 [Prosopis cineraria]
MFTFEFEQQETSKKRIMDVTFNDKSILTEPFTTQHLKLVTIVQNITQADHLRIVIKPTPEFDLPAMINAFEVYRVLNLPDSGTYQEDADALWSIKHIYEIPIMNWQGDPCIPNHFAWEGLTYTSDGNPRVISLNLSSRGLTGLIDVSFSRFTKLQSLDLSCNKLNGEVPEFFAQLSNLKFLESAHRFSTQITVAKVKYHSFIEIGKKSRSLSGWIMQDKEVSCSTHCIQHFAVLVMIVLIFLMIRRIKIEKRRMVEKLLSSYFLRHQGKEIGSFTQRQTLQNFQHFPYMHQVKFKLRGNLQGLLSERNPNVLNWSERLQIAADVGLDYLHNGIRPPVVHRDLKTTNILLNEKMQVKISDFGLCRSFANENDNHIPTVLAGTFGYLDPH